MPTTKLGMEGLLRLAVERDASDLHLSAGSAPHLRIDDELIATDHDVLSDDQVKALAYSLLSAEQVERFERAKELDFSFEIEGLARFRSNFFIQRGHVGAALRLLPFHIRTFAECGLPIPIVTDFCHRPKGLVLITGATGSGKSTSLASMVEYINQNHPCHIITVEDPIEYVYQNKKAIIDQREVGSDTRSFPQALRHVLRQDPDVILIGEMRDLDTIETALTVAETGHLVLATLHTSDAVQTINRIIDVFPSHQQSQVRVELSFVLLGVLSQQLIPRAQGRGRILATEVLVTTHAVRSLIREQKIHQMYSLIQTGQKEGMQTMNYALYTLYLKNHITIEEVMGRTTDHEDMRRLLQG